MGKNNYSKKSVTFKSIFLNLEPNDFLANFFKMFLSTSFANSAFYKKYMEKKFRENFVDNRLLWVGDDSLDLK